MKKYNWGILGVGVIAQQMGKALLEVNNEIYAVCATTLEGAQAYQKEFDVQKAYGSAKELIDDEHIDVVYIATPHNSHYEFLKQSLLAGKHVLVEKAITVNSNQLEECVAIAKEKGLIIMEAMTIFHMPLFKKLKEMVESGIIGDVNMIQVNFGSCKEYDPNNRFFSKELAGGALLDIGGYATSFARYFLSSQPNVVLTTTRYFETGVDEQSGILMKNDSGQMVVMALTMRAKQPKRGVIAGTLGYIEVSDYPRADKAKIVYTEDGRVEEITLGERAKALNYEVEDMQACIANKISGEQLRYVRDVSSLLSEIRNQWGFVYPFEKK